MNILYYGGGVEVYCGSSASMIRNFFLLFSSLLDSKLFISTLLRKQIRAQCKLRGEDQILLMQAPIQEVDLAPQHGIEQWEDLDDLLANNVQQNDFTWWPFVSFVAGSVRNLPPTQHRFLLMLLAGFLSVLTITCAARFESFQVGKTTYTPEEAFYAFFLEVAHITCFIICWFIALILILPQQHVLHIFSGLLCLATITFGQLKEKALASGIHVASGDSFKLPLLWFAIILAVGFSLIIGLLLFTIVYLSWKFIHIGNPRAVEVNGFQKYGLILLISILHLIETCTTQFEFFQDGKTTNFTPEEAFYAFFPEVAHITGFIIYWILTFIFILPLQLVLQIFFGLVCLCSTIIYFFQLVQKSTASGVHVASGETLKLPMFWFAIIQAVGFSIIIGLQLLLTVYLSWRFIHRR